MPIAYYPANGETSRPSSVTELKSREVAAGCEPSAPIAHYFADRASLMMRGRRFGSRERCSPADENRDGQAIQAPSARWRMRLGLHYYAETAQHIRRASFETNAPE